MGQAAEMILDGILDEFGGYGEDLPYTVSKKQLKYDTLYGIKSYLRKRCIDNDMHLKIMRDFCKLPEGTDKECADIINYQFSNFASFVGNKYK